MFRVRARTYHNYTHLILALGIVREPTVWALLLQNAPAPMTLAPPIVFCLFVLQDRHWRLHLF